MSVAGKEFVLTHVVHNISSVKEGEDIFFGVEEHFNVPWKMNIERIDGFLGLYLFCEKSADIGEWLVQTEYGLRIASVTGMSLIRRGSRCYESSDGASQGNGFGKLIKWEEMMKDYVVDDKLIIEAYVKIKKTSGLDRKKLRNFDDTMKDFSDVVLVVNDEKFHVSRLFLASHSSYFKALLLGNFEESKNPEVTLTDINSNDFQNFLEVLHGESAIDDDTVDGILRLADMYDAKTANRRCEEFLIGISDKSLKQKLQISKKYNMQHLKSNCLLKIKTVEDIRSSLPGDLSEMDPSVATTLLHKLISLQQ